MKEELRRHVVGVAPAKVARLAARQSARPDRTYVPAVVVLAGRAKAERVAVGAFPSYEMIAVPVDGAPLPVHARVTYVRTLHAGRRPAISFAYEVGERAPWLANARNYTGQASLHYVRTNHAPEDLDLRMARFVVSRIIYDTFSGSYRLIRVESVQRMSGFDCDVYFRADLLGPDFGQFVAEALNDVKHSADKESDQRAVIT